MTRYDPFSFGQVKLGSASNAPPAEPQDPDDMLFADAGPSRQGGEADASWSLLNEDVGALLPGSPPEAFAAAAAEFGSEFLGENAPRAKAAPAPAPAPAAKARPRSAAPANRGGPVPTMSAAMPAAKPAAPIAMRDPNPAPSRANHAPARPSTPARVPSMPAGRRRARGAFTVVVPLAIVAAGGCGGAWFYVMQQNPIMGGIVAASAAIGGLFAWLLLRG